MQDALIIGEAAEYDRAATEAYSDHEERAQMGALGPRLIAEFSQAEMDRRLTEDRWLEDLRQYKGIYNAEVLKAIGPRRSKSFVRKTRVKVKTVDSRVADLLFPAGSEKNWTIDPTPRPSVSREHRAMILERLREMMTQQGQDASMLPRQVVEQAVKEFAKDSAKKMSETIDDQLVEARYKDVAIQAIHSCHLYGTGIVKGPLVERRVRTRFVLESGKWTAKSESYVVPFLDFVPVWRFYPDMNASKLEDCRYVWERHLMVASELAKLAERKSFRCECIKSYIKSHPRGEVRTNYVDNELKALGDRTGNQGKVDGQYEVFERWGWLTGMELREIGVKVPEERAHESFFSNVWVLPNGEVIKAVLQPINGVTWPYHIYSFDKDETSIFAEGLAAVMRDDQTMLNAAIRMMLDNMALSAGSMFEINPRLLTNYEKLDEVFPFKVWLRNAESPGVPAVRPIDFSSHMGDLSGMAQMFENNADEVTAIPRYMSGENVANGAAGTAAGMSMLMGAANIVIKDLITAWDEGVTRPFLTALYRWNMQFNPDNSIKGDFDVKARGAASLVAKEVRSRQLAEFSASVSNELDAPFVKRDRLLRQRAEAAELSDIIKTEDEVGQEMAQGPMAAQQQMQQQMQQIQLMLAQAQAAEAAAKVEKTKAEAARISAEESLTRAKEIGLKVGAVYSALQAGGVAAMSPQIAPAGDEILRSSGWKDDTPDPRIADLLGQSVQGQPPAEIPPMEQPPTEPMTGQVGMQQGIQTMRID